MLLNFIHSMKLKNKIFISCVTIVIIPIILVSSFLYNYMTYQTKEVFYENSSYVLIQAGNYLDGRLKGIFGRINAMMLNGSFNKIVKDYLLYDQSYLNAAAVSQLSDSFSEIRASDSFISSVFMHTPKGDFFDLAGPAKYGLDFTHTDLYKKIQDSPYSSIYWGDRGKDEFYHNNRPVVPLVTRFTLEGYSGDVFLVINLDQQAILSYLEGVQPGEGNWTILFDERGNEVFSYDHPVINALKSDSRVIEQVKSGNSGFNETRYHSEEYLVTYQSTNVPPWKIINIKSQRILMKNLDKLKFYTVALIFISIFICFLLALIISNTLTKPLALFQNTIKRVTDKNFDIQFEYKYPNELGQLADSFNYMVSEIKELIEKLNDSVSQLQEEKEKVRIEQLLKRRAELKALQAQINPHFLYNTLDSINWKANNIHASEISKMTTALAMLFRTGLSRGSEMIPLRDEISHVSSYLIIQKMRYGDKFNYTINISEELMNFYTIKLILQPLVENAIYHGIKEKEGFGNITIVGKMSDAGVELCVIDNGLGISPMKLDFINKKLREGMVVDKEGYGIYNVNERIKLYFGQEYGLTFASPPEEGTLAKIVLPKVEMGDVEKYVQYFGS